MAQDPFAATATDTRDGGPQSDPFGQPAGGGGKFPKPADLNGCLLLLTPVKVEQVQDRFNPGQTQDRLSADTLVLDGQRAGEAYDAMYWSQTPVVAAGQAALRKGARMVLGRLRRFPTADTKKAHGIETWKEMEELLDGWDYRARPNAPKFAWALDQYDATDAATAREYLAKHTASPFG